MASVASETVGIVKFRCQKRRYDKEDFEYFYASAKKTFDIEYFFIHIFLNATNTIEGLFYLIFHISMGYKRVYRMPLAHGPGNEYIAEDIAQLTGLSKEIILGRNAGCPDYLIIPESKKFFFVEIKNYKDKISKDQYKWAEKYGLKDRCFEVRLSPPTDDCFVNFIEKAEDDKYGCE